MAAAVMSNAEGSSSSPFRQRVHKNVQRQLPAASSSRPQQPLPSPELSTSSVAATPESPPKAFHRFRSTLEQSIRTATRSKKATPQVDEFATVSSPPGKGKERSTVVEDAPKEKTNMLRRFESKGLFRRTPRESLTPSPHPPTDGDAFRAAGFRFETPSMRQASMSSPALHLSSHALPSPMSQPVVTASSSNVADVLASPVRQRTRRSSLQQPTPPPQVSTPMPLGLKTNADGKSNGHAVMAGSKTPTSRHRPTVSNPPTLPSYSSPSTPQRARGESSSPTKQNDLPSLPNTPTNYSRPTGTQSPSQRRINTPSPTPHASSPIPIRARSPSTRIRVVTPPQKGASSSNLPLSSTPPSSPRRPSIDSPRRPSCDSPRRPSDSSRRPIIDSSHREYKELARSPSRDSPDGGRAHSPSSPVRLRPISPTQRSYSQNRHFNISAASLVPPYNPEHRERIRTATTLLCKEIVKPPPHMSRTEAGVRDWEEVELRTRNLARLERIWGKSGDIGSSSNISTSAVSPSGLSSSGEERERRLFSEALKDGYVLCQLMNKLRSSNVVKPDAREDGFFKTSNVTKFLAACASYGLPNEDLFQRDDLIEATGESLARVACTIIALIHFVESPAPSRSKYLSGEGKKYGASSTASPYSGSVSRGSASTPNLHPLSTSPSPSSPVRKRWSPPSALPPVPSGSPNESVVFSSKDDGNSETNVQDAELKDASVPQIMTPPPRSPLRPRTKRSDDGELSAWAKKASSPVRSSIADSTRASIGDGSIMDYSPEMPHYPRQSVASSAMTDITMSTSISSILDSPNGGSGGNKFGTIRTVTTDLTSEAPSVTRTEGRIIAEDLTRKRSGEVGGRYCRERKNSGGPIPDLSRVAEETDESVSSKGYEPKNGKREQALSVEKADPPRAVNLRKGIWPDDFLDAFQERSQPRAIPTKKPSPEQDESSRSSTPISTPISISPPRKLAIVGGTRRNESSEALPQSPRRPGHRTRHSIDAPSIETKELRRDASPDGVPLSPARVMLRRNSTKPNLVQRSGAFSDMNNSDSPQDADQTARVPFPQSLGDPSPSGDQSANERPRLRGRFQSDIEGTARRRARPSSYDDLGGKPPRTRFESMVNLGVGSGTASASDLISRDSLDGSAVRLNLVVREDGKPPTHFQLGNCIGRGQFGSVYRALNLNTGQMVAVKRIRLEGLKEDEISTLMREVDLVKSLSHPSIVKYEGMARDDDTLSIVLEYAENGSLGQTLRAFGKLNERLVASYVIKILEGLHYLHHSDVVHCDLKAANILTTKNGNVKLSDFGVSLNLRAMEREKDVAGTPNWMAPEVIELKGASTKSDIWSLACTVIELLTGRPPYADISNSMTVMFRIVEDSMPPLPEGCSPLLEDFLRKCFNKDPNKRPSAEALCEHPWLKKTWGALQDLRPQDSIPFLRRVSTDFQKGDAVRYLQQVEMADSSITELNPGVVESRNTSPAPRRVSDNASRPFSDNDISPREHSFVKTTFSKPMICRVCQLNVKKSAVLCSQCSLISHSKCAINAPPTCDLRAQLLLYAQYAEKGNPASIYSNPVDTMGDGRPKGAMSDVPYVAHTPRTSIDGPSPPPNSTPAIQPPHPPTAFKFMSAFKRSKSRTNLSPEPESGPLINSSTSSIIPATNPHENDERTHRRVRRLSKQVKGRPLSVTSDSTGVSSMRSAATAAESLPDTRRSHASAGEVDKGTGSSGATRPSRVTFSSGVSSEPTPEPEEISSPIPGGLPVDSRRQKRRDSKSSGGCVVQ